MFPYEFIIFILTLHLFKVHLLLIGLFGIVRMISEGFNWFGLAAPMFFPIRLGHLIHEDCFRRSQGCLFFERMCIKTFYLYQLNMTLFQKPTPHLNNYFIQLIYCSWKYFYSFV
jgi:hypothetical protein